MSLISMIKAAEKYKLSEWQVKRMFYRRGDAPETAGERPTGSGGRPTRLFLESEVDAFITKILTSEIIQPDEIDFIGIGKLLGKCTSHARFMFRNDCANAPRPLRYTGVNGRVIYKKADVLAYIQTLKIFKQERAERKEDVRTSILRAAPVENPHFDNRAIVQFITRPSAIRPRFVRTSLQPPKTKRVRLQGDWG